MLDPIVEVNRLKHDLRTAGLSTTEVDEIGNLAAQDIDSAIYDLTEAYLSQAKDVVTSLGGEELADELRAVKRGPLFIISTESGVTAFSTPPFPMLPQLLKNAKVSGSGEMYKVIPLSPGPSKRTSNIFDVYKNRNAEVRQQQEDRQANWDEVRTADAVARKSLSFSGLAQAKRYLAKRKTANKEDNSVNKKEAAVFRTASSKQAADLDWVLPAQDMNITNILNDINSQLEGEVDNTVSFIISQYGGLV